MRVDEPNSENAGADAESKPPAFQIIVLVCKTMHINSPYGIVCYEHALEHIFEASALVLRVPFSVSHCCKNIFILCLLYPADMPAEFRVLEVVPMKTM